MGKSGDYRLKTNTEKRKATKSTARMAATQHKTEPSVLWNMYRVKERQQEYRLSAVNLVDCDDLRVFHDGGCAKANREDKYAILHFRLNVGGLAVDT
jgi:hypothetical protein